MDTEKRDREAVKLLTRTTLERILLNPGFLIQMVGIDVSPVDVEEGITEILEYLDDTKEKAEG